MWGCCDRAKFTYTKPLCSWGAETHGLLGLLAMWRKAPISFFMPFRLLLYPSVSARFCLKFDVGDLYEKSAKKSKSGLNWLKISVTLHEDLCGYLSLYTKTSVDISHFTRRPLWISVTLHEELCGYLSLYMKTSVDICHFTRRPLWISVTSHEDLCGYLSLYTKTSVDICHFTWRPLWKSWLPATLDRNKGALLDEIRIRLLGQSRR
jgi:hypothetical protein